MNLQEYRTKKMLGRRMPGSVTCPLTCILSRMARVASDNQDGTWNHPPRGSEKILREETSKMQLQ